MILPRLVVDVLLQIVFGRLEAVKSPVKYLLAQGLLIGVVQVLQLGRKYLQSKDEPDTAQLCSACLG